ncbi:hypothetical protein NC651_037026 [Populus alba x Populus x berolinensis]|nr:hypothetical protein NC651_037026 [Populus alba x Populus x berolinensis]
MDPKGILEMVLMFLEDRGDGVLSHPSVESNSDNTNRILPFLGRWKGHHIVHWTGTRSDELVTFDWGYEMTLLPGGIVQAIPLEVHLRGDRLVRTYAVEGLATVSSTYFSETKM